uniref:hypothetical protein n=1 Tax=uncultured Paraglaciecola sp. TaxID=1765024 RepID=UPI00261D5EC2
NEASVASKAFVQTEIASAAASSKSAAAQVLTAKVAKEAADIRLAATAQQANSIRGFKRLTFVSGELSVAQRAATVAASNLTKAEAAATIATDRLALSQVAATRTAQALAVAQRAANGALALVGGPAGAALLAGGALIYLATRESEAEKSARTLTVALDGLDDAYKRNAQSASNAAAATIETEEANIIALQSKYDGLLATYEKLKNSSGVRARDYATEGVALGKLNEQLEAAKKRLEEFKSANENLADGGALITYSDRLENALQKARRAAASEGKAIREALTDLFPDDEKIAELEKLKTGLENIKDSLSPEEYTRAQRAINEQIQGLGEYKERADKAKEAANQLQSALYAAIPERQREDEFADQYDALEAAFNRGGKEADLYRQAMDALQKQFNDDTAKIQADKVRELNDALSERSATPFAKYSDEITLLNRAISELPDEAGNLADNLQRAFANLDFEIQAELTTVTGADNAALARDFAAKKDALEQFIVERARTEEQADADRVALAQSYGDQVIDINEQIQRRLVDLSGGSAAITFELDVVADTVALDQLLRDREITQDEYATAREAQERTHQEALNELVRSGEATRAQAEQASFQSRFAGVLEKYSTEIGAAQEAATAILDVRVNREKRQADEAKNIAAADEQTYQEALRAFEANGTEENKIALANAKKKRDISKAEAKKQFEDQKEASIASAKLSAGVAILNALATPPWYVGLAQAGIALYKTRDIIKGIKAQSYSGGGDVSAGGSVGAGGGNTGVAQTNSTQQTTVQPAERIVIVAGTFRTPDEAVAEGSRVMKESYEQGYIFNNPDGTQNFDNVPERVVRLNG